MQQIFVLVPSLHATGPVKGAVALANQLSEWRQVSIVSLKHGPASVAGINSRVQLVSLAGRAAWRDKLTDYRDLLRRAGGRTHTASISFCLSADWLNGWCRAFAVTCSSVRGNLPRNYLYDYGPAGSVLAAGHLLWLGRFDRVVAMTTSMADQIKHYSGRTAAVIGNFVDEASVELARDPAGVRPSSLRFCFSGSLTKRKQPQLLLQAAAALQRRGVLVELDFLGEGPLRGALAVLACELGLTPVVRFHGHLVEPLAVMNAADCLVLPSLSEGISRAVLESLHLGIPVVTRNADGNRELIRAGHNGALFDRPEDLSDVMLTVANWSRLRTTRTMSLLPESFRQRHCARRYLDVVDSANS